MTCIEQAKANDLASVVKLNAMALDEVGNLLPYEIDAAEAANNVLSYWKQAPCFLLKEAGEIVGFAGLMLTKPYFSKAPMLKDYMFYVLPEYRSVKNLSALCDATKQFASDQGLCLVLNYIVNNDLEPRRRLIERMGFRVTGITGVFNG